MNFGLNVSGLTRQNGLRLAIALIALAGTGLIHPALAQQASPTESQQTAPQQMAQSSTLSGSWRLANMTAGNSPMPMLPSEELTLEFADGRVAGSGGCNRFMGGYETTGQNLSIGPLASTFKACEEPIMSQEMNYLQALQGAQRYELNDQGLTITYQTDQGSGVLRFLPAEAAETGAQSGGTQSSGSQSSGTQPGGTQEGVRGLW
jgi:heat shock protein HslJ